MDHWTQRQGFHIETQRNRKGVQWMDRACELWDNSRIQKNKKEREIGAEKSSKEIMATDFFSIGMIQESQWNSVQ